MSSGLVAVFYLFALVLPLYLLYYFHAQGWYWHLLAVAAALALGFVPTPPEWKTMVFDMAFGCTFVFLMVWGIGGLVLFPAGGESPHSNHQRRHHA
jgi:hypothetical protein